MGRWAGFFGGLWALGAVVALGADTGCVVECDCVAPSVRIEVTQGGSPFDVGVAWLIGPGGAAVEMTCTGNVCYGLPDADGEWHVEVQVGCDLYTSDTVIWGDVEQTHGCCSGGEFEQLTLEIPAILATAPVDTGGCG